MKTLAQLDREFFTWQADHPDLGPEPTTNDHCGECGQLLVWDGFDGKVDLFRCPTWCVA